MDYRLLGWAGVQLRAGDATLVIDPLADAGAVWGWAGDRAAEVDLPPVVPAAPAGTAGVALVTHLHRDHADADALRAALAPDGLVLTPARLPGSEVSDLALAQADAELTAAGLARRAVAAWEVVEVDGWRITALPAVDGVGDPQVSWLVERDGVAVVHGGDTLPHAWWWRVAEHTTAPIAAAFLPVNGARVAFPHRQPASPLRAAMNLREAQVAADTLGAALVPIHYGAYHFAPVYVPEPDPQVEAPALGAWVTA